MIVFPEPEHPRAEQRRAGQIERRVRQRLQPPHQLRFTLVRRKPREILGREQCDSHRRLDELQDLIAFPPQATCAGRIASGPSRRTRSRTRLRPDGRAGDARKACCRRRGRDSFPPGTTGAAASAIAARGSGRGDGEYPRAWPHRLSRVPRRPPSPRPATVGASNSVRSDSVMSNSRFSRAVSCAASSEWPPSAKKSSWMPMPGSANVCSMASAMRASRSSRGGTRSRSCGSEACGAGQRLAIDLAIRQQRNRRRARR